VSRLSVDLFSPQISNPATPYIPTAPKPAAPLRPSRLTRRYEIAYLTAAGDVACATRIAPAMPEIEEAFSAFARGTVIATTEGPVAIEDIVPGMEALTAEGRSERITWVGSMTLFPNCTIPGVSPAKMTRITADAFGIGRPMPDLVLGPCARLLLRDARSRLATGVASSYAPARCFVDGVSIIEVTPVAPVTVFHLVLERQGSIRAAGLEIESFHPGGDLYDRFDPQLAAEFLGLFPHLRGFAEFGPMAHPRLSAREVEAALSY
jgi:hypothetical protein